MKSKMTPKTRHAIIQWIVQSILGWIGYGVLIFLTAGKLDWIWGWAILAVIGAFLAAHPILLIPINPDLLAEREKGVWDREVKAWDKWVTALAAGVFPVASWIVAGLDIRFHWSRDLPLGVHLIGLLVMVLGFALFLWAMTSNAFFSEGVRIQSERGHTVATNGPYRYVRHPGYAGAILSQLSTPFLLGSPWALIPSLISGFLYLLRTHMEDTTLQAELPGYQAYTRQTRYRLLPGVW
jgi:protein-S-isoprenylcysteine O-methyltransferase Ste14